jgi:hypothetical protein
VLGLSVFKRLADEQKDAPLFGGRCDRSVLAILTCGAPRFRRLPSDSHNALTGNNLANQEDPDVAHGKQNRDSSCHTEALHGIQGGSSLEYLVTYWPKISPHSREAIMTFVDAAIISADSAGCTGDSQEDTF